MSYRMLIGVVTLSVMVLACAGTGSPPSPSTNASSTVSPAAPTDGTGPSKAAPAGNELQPEPAGYRRGPTHWDGGVYEACDAKYEHCGLLAPDGTWLYQPIASDWDDAGDGVALGYDTALHGTVYVDARTGRKLLDRTFTAESGKFFDHRAWARDAATSLDDTSSNTRYMGYVLLDPEGHVVKDFGRELFSAYDFSDGLSAAYLTAQDPDDTDEDGLNVTAGLAGYLGADGAWAIAPTFRDVEPFKDGRAKVIGTDGRRYLIGKDGQEVH